MASTTAERYEFYHKVVSTIPGWLHQGAAIRTIDMLEFQEDTGIAGSVLEIGVLCGRYFSILVRSAARTGARALGVDLFHDHPVDKVRQLLEPALRGGRAHLQLLPAFSTDLDASLLLSHLVERARFISVDGSHECNDVYCDLGLAEQVLAPGGVVALDDFLNPVTLGVNEAVHRFFGQPRRVVPWAFIENKLFLCQTQWSHRYRNMLEDVVMRDAAEPHSKVFRDHAQVGRGLVEQRLWGHPLLMVP
jgi:SAM-dependent methyltransferase